MNRIVQLVVLLLILTGQIEAQLIAEWRGYHRAGIYNEKNLLKEWPENGPDLIWFIDGIGEGYSSASVNKNAIFLTGLIDSLEYVELLLSTNSRTVALESPIDRNSLLLYEGYHN